jgi:hypothetical protein
VSPGRDAEVDHGARGERQDVLLGDRMPETGDHPIQDEVSFVEEERGPGSRCSRAAASVCAPSSPPEVLQEVGVVVLGIPLQPRPGDLPMEEGCRPCQCNA